MGTAHKRPNICVCYSSQVPMVKVDDAEWRYLEEGSRPRSIYSPLVSTSYSVCVRNGFRRATECVPHAYGINSAPYAEYLDAILSHS